MSLLRFLLFSFLLSPLPLLAAENVRVLALFSGRAMLDIDGRQKVLKVGQKPFNGVRLLSASSSSAEVEVNGERQTMRVGAQADFNAREDISRKAEVSISRSADGHYYTTAFINGRSVNVVIDTGATSVAMSSVEAKRLGIQYRLIVSAKESALLTPFQNNTSFMFQGSNASTFS
ncbi:MAG: retroviral-like aspartic protease family protein, partial [gamma proteobacterium symbiont of Bathyaustriella thionipta]|nr:retroviral-like aspartic protease family protein [gamma proteobacterium symbiont of Bathyaustriella thionipta]